MLSGKDWKVSSSLLAAGLAGRLADWPVGGGLGWGDILGVLGGSDWGPEGVCGVLLREIVLDCD